MTYRVMHGSYIDGSKLKKVLLPATVMGALPITHYHFVLFEDLCGTLGNLHPSPLIEEQYISI